MSTLDVSTNKFQTNPDELSMFRSTIIPKTKKKCKAHQYSGSLLSMSNAREGLPTLTWTPKKIDSRDGRMFEGSESIFLNSNE